MNESYWATREGRLEQAIRGGLRDAGVRAPLAWLVDPVLRAVLRELVELDRSQTSADDTQPGAEREDTA